MTLEARDGWSGHWCWGKGLVGGGGGGGCKCCDVI